MLPSIRSTHSQTCFESFVVAGASIADYRDSAVPWVRFLLLSQPLCRAWCREAARSFINMDLGRCSQSTFPYPSGRFESYDQPR
jgi:hypothetical protein